MANHVDISSQGEIVEHIKSRAQQGLVKECALLKVEKRMPYGVYSGAKRARRAMTLPVA